ncbi:hypothetical protein GQ600_8752 [Phytophthora cactorum]|nr:hypothetical protein GQ600_8752 [Phytophthora cactorum]
MSLASHSPAFSAFREEESPAELSCISHSNVLQEGLEALFTSECLVLVGYLHTSIAMFYANFVLVMVYLPSAQYHSELHGVTSENVADTVKSVFILASSNLFISLFSHSCSISDMACKLYTTSRLSWKRRWRSYKAR